MSETLNLSDRIQSRRVAAADEPDTFDDCGAFGLLRGGKERAVMLDVRLTSGSREAFAYALLERVSFDPSEGLTLWFPGVRVRLRGRNFAAALPSGVSFLEALQRHRVAWVQEVDPLRGTTAPPAAVVVTAVELIHGR